MIREQILEMLEEYLEDEVVKEDLDINLKEEGLMDSLAFVEMLVRIEENFGLSIAPTEVTYEEIDTPNKVISYIENRLG
ncbi:D-alanine--poly(phosphoribitol) ligase subunit DltC [Gemella morbillorum]